jgi:hypothetical protein
LLVKEYSIPLHIAIIMTSLGENSSFPRSTDKWSFAHRVHPSVRHALFYAK